eukprot:TRINITY_DN27581_c0_g1_i1.p4 TRINITY_DN27581_c0_g1~~TRINITY_DN27581_c0_g1_i1.p4  ORF type:complete len:101 (+),score=21.88 TRINITY_DN27581_c0_g1_i1:96-398(+)
MFFFLMIRRPPRSTHCISSAASDVYKRQEYMGMSVSNIELDKPPINTQASPFFQTEPAPVARAIGSIAIIIEKVVIKIGRNRMWVASSKASTVERPSFLL